MRRRCFIAGAAALCAPAAAARAPAGETLRLVGVRAPETAAGFEEPYAEESRRAFAVILAMPFAMQPAGAADRWGRAPAVLLLAGGESAQAVLVAQGAAQVAPEGDDHDFIRTLLALEEEARAARRGLWAHQRYRVHDAGDARRAIGAFNLVEGAPLAAARRGGRVYLNFGDDYRTDFTASARAGLARAWARNGLDLETLAGERLRIRGYVAAVNGPSVDLAHPLQIERLDMKTPTARQGAPA